MNATCKTTVLTLAAVAAAHIVIAGAAATQMNSQAASAMLPVVHADKIVVTAKRMEVFTADKIVVRATPKTAQLAVLSWNRVV